MECFTEPIDVYCRADGVFGQDRYLKQKTSWGRNPVGQGR
jgi:hypothetical protein